ncbi:hypothetical protein NLJ89_g9510 [Agrocybe chaxingu]|uniref:Zinc finger PHD-type domain-containing protein n=1 Tax=Agrocybe chaxingu TaxID=84603 RepID=A0A9W8JSX0_9AGAR|nr:hypothetical protein NLJ89_g9510 [Agrocybe chaxingu]
MPTPCTLCRKVQSTTSPNFLLTCLKCARAWHHRCHVPPVPDKELITVIKAYNEVKHKPDARFNWTCGLCKAKVKPSSHAPSSSGIKPKPVPETIVIDDDDDVVVLEERRPAPLANTKRELSESSAQLPKASVTLVQTPNFPSTSKVPTSPEAQKRTMFIGKKTAQLTAPIRITDDPISFAKVPEQRQSLKPTLTSSRLVSDFVDLTMSDEDDGPDHPKDNMKLPKSASPTLSAVTSNEPAPTPPQSVILSVGRTTSTPQPPSRSDEPVSRRTVAEFSAEPDDREIKAEQIMVALSPPMLSPMKGPPAQKDNGYRFNPALLPYFVNARYSVDENDDKAGTTSRTPDIWQRRTALKLKRKQKLSQASMESVESSTPDLGVIPSNSPLQRPLPRRKKAVAVPSPKASMEPGQSLEIQTPFFFAADAWMEQKRRQMLMMQT